MSQRFHRRAALWVACVIPLAGHAADAAPPLQLSDLPKIISLREPKISPDGKQIAVLVSTPDWKTDKAKTEIDLVDTATGSRRPLTWKRTGLGAVKWSPDGSRLAFLADDIVSAEDATDTKKAGETQAQVFVMSLQGGDPIRVTDTAHGVEEFSWSPDGSQLAYVTPNDAPNAQAIKEHNDVFQVTDNDFLKREALTPWHLRVVPSGGGTPKRLTDGSYSLDTDAQDEPPIPAWDPSGRSIAFTRFPGPYWGPSFRAVIASVATAGGEPQTLVADPGSYGASYAPDAERLAYIRSRGGDQNNGDALYVVDHGVTTDSSRKLARSVNSYAWMPGGDALLVQGPDETHSALWLQPLAGATRKLDLGDVEPNADLSVAKTGAVAFIGVTSTHPGELYVLDSVQAKPRRLTDLNAFVDDLKLGRTESITWRGPGGFDEDGVLTYPVGFQQGQKYPLVLVIHGGPTGASSVRFSVLPQLLSAAGFVVFQPNYRGSNNLGDAYQHAIFRDTGDGPGKDVMAGLAAVKKLGIVDERRIGVSGWSYGGYMTTWLTGHYTGFKAAVAGAALTDWVMDYTVAYYQEGDTYLFGGSPWNAKYHDIWRQQSPITYAAHVTAPTLIMGDVGDNNVPLINSYEWFHALRDAGVKVEFYAYPADTHFPHDIVRSSDVYRRWVAWMTQELK